mmetsp:Transcript_22848/g.22689  ORF Transcript_22848/g.22689 Transcript_22848/m.22689 type:complete len:458 (-) Transcript_22848:2-1375(-)
MKTIIFSLLIISAIFAAREADLMAGPLPGCSNDNFNQYSGYLDVTSSKKFHYVFVESQNDPANDPLLFWFNGGPGCSSMIGFISENGPCVFLDDADHTPQDNPHSWNKFANIVYLESPASVGFNHFTGIPTYNDEKVSHENLKAVQEWFQAFPEYKEHELYLSGESYAGIYVPYLALRIDEYNQESNDHINLKGFFIGNGVTNWKYDTTPAFVELAFAHGLINLDLQERINKANCDFTEVGGSTSLKCRYLLSEFYEQTKHVYPYDIYRPPEEIYTSPNPGNLLKSLLFSDDDESECRYGGFAGAVRNMPKRSSNEFLPVKRYLNKEEVKAALNIPSQYSWSECKGIGYTKSKEASQWIYPKLKGRYRMMHYSGTTDAVVPTIGTERWMNDLGWPTVTDRKPWFSEPLLIGGYTESREGNLDFITIHGTGHMVPQWKRPESAIAISHWLAEDDLPRE